jgi:hypothetical protein
MNKFKIEYFGEGEYVIVSPVGIIGNTLSKHDAHIVRNWANCAIPVYLEKSNKPPKIPNKFFGYSDNVE